MKKCNTCAESLPLERFSKGTGRQGLQNKCKDCQSEYYQKWSSRSAEARKEYMKSYNQRLTASGYRSEWQRDAYRKNKNFHRDRILDRAHRRRLIVSQNILPQGYRTALVEFYQRCLRCGSVENLTLDHVVPISLGGAHACNNFQVLCKSCNSRKGARSSADYRKGRIFDYPE